MVKRKQVDSEAQFPDESLVIQISDVAEPDDAKQPAEVEEPEAPVDEQEVEKSVGLSLMLSPEIIQRIKSGEFRPLGAYSVITIPDEVIDDEKQKNFVMMLLINAVTLTGHVDAPVSAASLPSVKSRKRKCVEGGRLHVYRERV